MGCGSWTSDSFKSYSKSVGRSVSKSGVIDSDYSNQEMFKSRCLDSALDPKNVIRECCDSEEHPNTLPVILALDVTGSMGEAAVEVAKKLNVIMTKLYKDVKDVEFMIMGIGDLAYDDCPIQVSQFESDIRIAEQLDKIYFEFGGGGNGFESYTAAWYFGSRHTKLDCLKRGRKGIIITMGDEQLNPYLPLRGRRSGLIKATGDNLQADVETNDLYDEASKKFNIYHLDVNHYHRWNEDEVEKSYKEYLDDTHFRKVTIDNITNEIVDIIINEAENNTPDTVTTPSNSEEITW
nr:MAG TPA: Integrin beta chain VWA domain [Caudoviricetes sp.]